MPLLDQAIVWVAAGVFAVVQGLLIVRTIGTQGRVGLKLGLSGFASASEIIWVALPAALLIFLAIFAFRAAY